MSDTPKTAAPTDSAPNIPAKQNNEAEYNVNVPVDLISPDPKNRDKIDPARVDQLAENIADVGLLQPVIVRMMKDGKYQLIAGEHRWRAVKKLKIPTIAARIYRNQTELEAAKRKTAENALRVDLTPIERAKRYQELQQLGASQKDIGSVCGGVSQPVVANALRLLSLPVDVQKLVAEGTITEAHGVILVRFARWPKVCSKIAALVTKNINSQWHAATSKWLNDQVVPYAHELVSAKLIIEINRETYNGPSYVIPPELMKDPDFIGNHRGAYYVLPEPGQPNKWEPERKKQDAAREAKNKVQEKQAAIAKAKDGKLSKEALARKKTITDNKNARTLVSVTLAGAVSRLAEAKDAPSTAVQVVFENSVKSGYLEEAAKKLGIKLPATEDEIDDFAYSDGYRELNYQKLYTLSDDNLLRLAAATVLLSEASDAQRYASRVPGCVEHIAAGKLLVPPVEDEEVKAEKPDWIAQVEGDLDRGDTPGQIAKIYADRKGALKAVQAIKKSWKAKREAEAVIEASRAKPAKKKGRK
jgi:ParB/RepB/Spo0J family partition protein